MDGLRQESHPVVDPAIEARLRLWALRSLIFLSVFVPLALAAALVVVPGAATVPVGIAFGAAFRYGVVYLYKAARDP